jgi:O-antigen ligase
MFSYSVFAEKSLSTCRYLAILAAIASPISTAVTGVMCVALLVTWLLSGQAWQSLKLSASQPAGKMLLVFFAWLLIGCFYADTALTVQLTTLSSWKKLLYTFILLGLFYPIEWKKRFVSSFLIAMTFSACVAIVLWGLHIDFKGRGVGIFMTNYSAQSLAFVAAIVCSLFTLKESPSPRKRYALIGIIFLFLFNIFFVSASRSGYLALPVAVIFTFIYLYGLKKIPHILGGMVMVLMLLLSTSSTLQNRIKLGLHEKSHYQTSTEVTSIGIRMIFAENSWELIQKRPIFGYGTSSFKSTYSPYVAQKYQDWRGEEGSDPHNQYLFIWLENGIIGLGIFLVYIYTVIRQGVHQNTYGAIAASVLIAIASTSLFNSNFKTFPEGHLLAFFVGCLLAQTPVKKEKISA